MYYPRVNIHNLFRFENIMVVYRKYSFIIVHKLGRKSSGLISLLYSDCKYYYLKLIYIEY